MGSNLKTPRSILNLYKNGTVMRFLYVVGTGLVLVGILTGSRSVLLGGITLCSGLLVTTCMAG